MAKLLGFLGRKFNDFALDHFFVVALLFGLNHGLVARNLHGPGKQVAFVQDSGSGLNLLVTAVEFQQTINQTHHGEFAVVEYGRNVAFESECTNREVHVFVFETVFSLTTHGHVFKRCGACFALGVDTDVITADFNIFNEKRTDTFGKA